MAQFTTDQLRNVALLGHTATGKTSLGEAVLFVTKAINRMGRVEDGNTVADYEPEEHKRQTSLQLAVLPCIRNTFKINFLDTPGYADFIGETVSTLRVADSAILVDSLESYIPRKEPAVRVIEQSQTEAPCLLAFPSCEEKTHRRPEAGYSPNGHCFLRSTDQEV